MISRFHATNVILVLSGSSFYSDIKYQFLRLVTHTAEFSRHFTLNRNLFYVTNASVDIPGVVSIRISETQFAGLLDLPQRVEDICSNLIRH